jgi:plastocyanin
LDGVEDDADEDDELGACAAEGLVLMRTRSVKLTRLLAAGYFSRLAGMPRGLRTLTLLGAVAFVTATGRSAAAGAPVRGTVAAPEELKSARHHQGYWRVESGVPGAQLAGSKGDVVVLLTGVKGTPPPARTITVEINGFQTINAGLGTPQATWVVGEGSVVEFKNSDRVAHDLSIPELPELMPVERLVPGQIRRQRFGTAGAYSIKCSEYPHLTASIVVMASPFYAIADDKGGFKIADVPEGKATLKVWSHGRWIHEEAIEVGPKTADLRIKPTLGKPAPATTTD